MNHYSSNAIHALTNEQRKALAQCLVFKARPAEILLHTKYVLISPLGELELAAEAGQDWLRLHQEGYEVDPITGAIVEIPAMLLDRTESSDRIPRENDLTTQYDAPKFWGVPSDWLPVRGQVSGTVITGGYVVQPLFTPAQERRIREIVIELIRRALADSAEEIE